MPMVAIKEAFYKIAEHILKVHCFISYDIYLHMKFGIRSSNHTLITLDNVVMLGPWSILQGWYIIANRKSIRKLISLFVLITYIQSIKKCFTLIWPKI